jgi:hypothetical protein
MKKNELALAVARELRHRATTSAATPPSRPRLVKVATAPSERLATVAVLPRRPSGTSRTEVSTVAVMVAALGRLRRTKPIVLSLASVVLAGVLGAAVPLLIDPGTAQGVARTDIVAPIPASQASSDMGGSDKQRSIAGSSTRSSSTEPLQKSTPLADGGAKPTSIRSAAVVAAQEEGLNALDQPSEAQARSSEGASEPSTSATPHAAGVDPQTEQPTPEPSAGADSDAEQPTPQPSADPAPGSPVDEEAEEDEQAGEKVTLCHEAGSTNPKTIVVGQDAVEEHLAHGDTNGACP